MAAVAAPGESERSRAPATLPPELWTKVWHGLDHGFHGGTGKTPEIHMDGVCKCGKLTFRVDGNLAAAFHCHCHMCRMYWSQGTPQHILWVRPETAVTITSGKEHLKTWKMDKLSHNLRGMATISFASCCGTNINVNFSDPNGTFTLMWPYNFKYEEFGDLATQRGAKARHGYSEVFRPRFHAHYENRSHDHEDTLPKLADIWLEGMPLMDNEGYIIGKVEYPMRGFEHGWEKSPTSGYLRAQTVSAGISYRAVLVSKEGKAAKREMIRFDDLKTLPYQDESCDVTVKVTYSNINFKDGIVLTGGAGVAKKFPIVPGIDFAGKVLESKSSSFKPGQSVVLTGHYNGQHMDGGLADVVRTKSEWLIPLPEHVSERESMIIGTAGFTGMMCVMALEKYGNLKRGEKDPVLVNGASGGVGSFATAILKHLGYYVVGSVLDVDKFGAYVRSLGCNEVIGPLEQGKPLGKEKYAGVVDPVGGQTLAAALSECKYGRAVSSCGLAGSSELKTTVMPFILRGVKLLGIDSVQAPMDVRMEVWDEFARIKLPKSLFEQVATEYTLEDCAGDLGPNIMAGKITGRAIINLGKTASKL